MTMRRLSVLFLIAACGAKPAPPQLPMLPGDGDAHVAKPVETKPTAAAPPSDPWSARQDLIPMPTVGAPPLPLPVPNFDEFKLANGLTVYVVKNDRLPVVSMQIAIRAGRMQEPRARLGVAEMTADMLVKGTARHDALGLAKQIDYVGGTIAADATFEATLVSCSVLARNLGTCFDLVPEIVTQPAFPEAELAQMRDRLIGGIRQRFGDPATLASAHAQNLLWGSENVRGWINNEESIGALRRDDLVAWHKTWFVPNNAMLVVTGDVDPKRVRGDIERAFGSWKKAPLPPAPTFQEPGLSGSRIRLVDMPGQTQTQIRIAQFAIKHDDPRFFDTLVWNYILGGAGETSRLNRGLRAAGNNFSVATSSFDRNLDRGSFVAQTAARSSEALTTTKAMLAEIAKMAKDGPTQDELTLAIANITGSYGLRFQSAADLGAALVGAELHGFGREYLTNFPVAVGQVSLDDAKRAAGEILDPRAYVIVLVGDAKDLVPQLKKEGWRYETVAFSTPITPALPGQTPAPAAPDKPIDPKVAAAAHKLIDEAIAAKGGKAKLAAVKGLRVVSSGTTTIQGQNLPIEIERVLVLPDRMRIDAKITPPGQRTVEVNVGVANRAGWQRGPDPKTGAYAVVDITGDALQDIDFERWREPELILLKAADPAARVSTGADETIDGKPYTVVNLGSPYGVTVAIYLDKQTKLVRRMSYNDGKNSETDDLQDYRDVNGIKLAYKRMSAGQGRSTSLDVKTLEVDPKVDDALFTKPSGK